MPLLEDLKWRYATKKFDPSKKVSEEDIKKLKEAVNLAATSYGLQHYKVLIINNKEIREELKPVSWGQSQITDASHFFVFCNYTKVELEDIDSYVRLIAKTRGMDLEHLEGFRNIMKEKISEKSPSEQENWLSKQTYIALGTLLAACASLKIDTCPMEGFSPEEYNKILSLKEKGLNVAMAIAIGYRDESDPTKDLAKVRKPTEELFEEI